ncbi:hypothetical protein ACFX2H_040318 [Malus domestica]
MGNAIQVFGLQQNQAQLEAIRIEEMSENNYGCYKKSNDPAYATNGGNRGKSKEEQAHIENLSIFARMGLKRGTERKNKCIFQPPQQRGRCGTERFNRQGQRERCLEAERLLFSEENLQEVPIEQGGLQEYLEDTVNIERMELQDRREDDGS